MQVDITDAGSIRKLFDAVGKVDAVVSTAGHVHFGHFAKMPRGIRINSISPTLLTESVPVFASYFLGHETIPGTRVANAYVKSVEGLLPGQTIHVL